MYRYYINTEYEIIQVTLHISEVSGCLPTVESLCKAVSIRLISQYSSENNCKISIITILVYQHTHIHGEI